MEADNKKQRAITRNSFFLICIYCTISIQLKNQFITFTFYLLLKLHQCPNRVPKENNLHQSKKKTTPLS